MSKLNFFSRISIAFLIDSLHFEASVLIMSHRRSRQKTSHQRRPLEILYDDDHWLVVQKPAGISVHPGAGAGLSVVERLELELGSRLFLVHRLDRGTAGVLLLAKTAEYAKKGSSIWPKVQKRYWAFTRGRPKTEGICKPLRDPEGRLQPAETHVEHVLPLRNIKGIEVSLCRVRLLTGRYHQIRKHLALEGCPILMDDKHGDFKLNHELNAVARELGLSRPKYPFLFCYQLRSPPGECLPVELLGRWPRVWRAWLEASRVSVDDLVALA